MFRAVVPKQGLPQFLRIDFWEARRKPLVYFFIVVLIFFAGESFLVLQESNMFLVVLHLAAVPWPAVIFNNIRFEIIWLVFQAGNTTGLYIPRAGARKGAAIIGVYPAGNFIDLVFV